MVPTLTTNTQEQSHRSSDARPGTSVHPQLGLSSPCGLSPGLLEGPLEGAGWDGHTGEEWSLSPQEGQHRGVPTGREPGQHVDPSVALTECGWLPGAGEGGREA